MYDNAVQCVTIDALNVNIQWNCRAIYNRVPVNLYDSREIYKEIPVNLYDTRAIYNGPVNLYNSSGINNKSCQFLQLSRKQKQIYNLKWKPKC